MKPKHVNNPLVVDFSTGHKHHLLGSVRWDLDKPKTQSAPQKRFSQRYIFLFVIFNYTLIYLQSTFQLGFGYLMQHSHPGHFGNTLGLSLCYYGRHSKSASQSY